MSEILFQELGYSFLAVLLLIHITLLFHTG